MKEETKHTPGPWHIGSGDWAHGQGSIMAVYDDRSICLALAWISEQGPPPTRGEAEANAHLIAAAPMLLEAARDIIVRAKYHDEKESVLISRAQLSALEDAFAAAKGGRG